MEPTEILDHFKKVGNSSQSLSMTKKYLDDLDFLSGATDDYIVTNRKRIKIV